MGSSGRQRIGACGHVETAVIGQFYLCSSGDCDGRVGCRKCGSKDVEQFASEIVPVGSWHCLTCGKVWWAAS